MQELGPEVPGQYKEQVTQTLIVHLLKTHFLHRSSILKSLQNRIELVTRPDIGIASYPADTLSATSTLLGGGGGLTADHEALDHVEGLLINLLVLLTKRPLPLTMAQVEVSHEFGTRNVLR